jgi:hypothetical protein
MPWRRSSKTAKHLDVSVAQPESQLGTGQTYPRATSLGPKGRRGPRYPTAPPKCYACGEPNHIARNCTNPAADPSRIPGLVRTEPEAHLAQEVEE